MPVRKKRPIYTRVGRIKPLGKSRMVKKAKPRPWRPFKITSYRLKERLPRVEGLIIHRRPSGRPDVALDPRELRAVPLSKIRGTLPERIFYKQLRKRRLSPDRDFDFQSSLLGGRLQLGGIVADFLFPLWRLIVRIQGPTHTTRVQFLKDQQQTQLLVDMGWTVYDLPDEIVYDMMALETWMRRHIDRHPSLGGQQVIGQTVFLATGQMNFAWTAQEHTRVAALEDAVENLIRDMSRIEGKAVVTINGLSDIDTNLGLVRAGEFRTGNNRNPGGGFTGVRIGYPAFFYDSEEWHIVGVNNDVLQFGIRATDGKLVAGGGDVILDEDGIQLVQGSGTTNSLRWIDGAFTVGQLWASGTYAAGILGNMAVLAATDKFANLQLQAVSGSGGDLRYTRLTIAGRGDVGLGIGIKYRFFTTLDADGSDRILLDLREEEAIFNPFGEDIDWRVHGENVDDIIHVDASVDKAYYKGVEIGTGSGGDEGDMDKLSESTDGLGIKVAATGTPGTTIHTAPAGTSTLDEVWIYAVATGAVDRKLTLEWGGVAAPDDHIEVTVTAEAGLLLIAPGLVLQNSKVLKAFAAAADEIVIHGHVITRTV